MKHWSLLTVKILNLLTPIFPASSFSQSSSPTAIALLQNASFDDAIFGFIGVCPLYLNFYCTYSLIYCLFMYLILTFPVARFKNKLSLAFSDETLVIIDGKDFKSFNSHISGFFIQPVFISHGDCPAPERFF